MAAPRLGEIATVTLFRAVGLNEAADIRSFGGFRLGPGSAFVEGKWFAITLDDALRWGRNMPPIDRPWSFVVASVGISARLLADLDSVASLDGIGPAYFARRDQLPLINASGRIDLSSVVNVRSRADEPIV